MIISDGNIFVYLTDDKGEEKLVFDDKTKWDMQYMLEYTESGDSGFTEKIWFIHCDKKHKYSIKEFEGMETFFYGTAYSMAW